MKLSEVPSKNGVREVAKASFPISLANIQPKWAAFSKLALFFELLLNNLLGILDIVLELDAFYYLYKDAI